MKQHTTDSTGLRRLGEIPLLGFVLRWLADFVRFPIIHRHIARHVQSLEERALRSDERADRVQAELASTGFRLDAANLLLASQAAEIAGMRAELAAEVSRSAKIQADNFSKTQTLLLQLRNDVAEAKELVQLSPAWDDAAGFVEGFRTEAASIYEIAARPDGRQLIGYINRGNKPMQERLQSLERSQQNATDLARMADRLDTRLSHMEGYAASHDEVRAVSQRIEVIASSVSSLQEETAAAQNTLDAAKNLAFDAERIAAKAPDASVTLASGSSSLIGYLGGDRLLARTKRGLYLICDSRDLQIMPQLVTQGVWEETITTLYERLVPAGGSYLEIGANIGYFTCLAISHIGHYGSAYSYEPNPRACRLLHENLRINRQSYLANVRPLAVADSVGRRSLNAFVNNMPSSTLASLDPHLLREMHEDSTAIEVDCTTLDHDFQNSDIRFDVIKVDAEGSEPLILLGASNFLSRNVKSDAILILEWNPVAMQGLNIEGAAIFEILFRHRFQVFKVDPDLSLRSVRGAHDLDQWSVADLLATRATESLRTKGFKVS